ncbi:glutathione S-transferase family protein [Parvularcula sp. IMCC14364]|uniref:glutathione S-transferase family protein n=1 Tax=Parvularcula sp. IMCC14364 TaxID=3067902 RepID=UPI0027411DF6|nr:glutathione S-transferase [Parvularcula sp. IMCC14364]
MIVVHHLENSRSQRIIWLLEELGTAYEIRHYERDKETSLAPKELLDVHPLGKSPIITDGDLVVAESGAIVEYLIEKYGDGRLQPVGGAQDRLNYRYWLHHAEGTAAAQLVLKLIFTRVKEQKLPIVVKQIAHKIADKVLESYVDPNVQRSMVHWESALSETGWFAGEEMSGADIMMSFPLEAASARAGLGRSFPNISEFLDRIHALPNYQKALAKGGKYDFVQ